MPGCLIVDGSSVVRKVAKRILADTQETVVCAETGSEALSGCATHHPEIVMVDAELDDLDLVSFIRQLRSMEGGADVKIIVMLTEFDLVSMTKAKRAGADDYLLKPFNRQQLMSRFTSFQQAA